MAKTSSTKKLSRKMKVWHIVDFRDLYELADDVRKERSGPLRYTKSLVTLSPFCADAESRHFERMRRLKARPKRHLLRSIFEDLKNWVSEKPFGLRGYLVTSEGKAATSEYLAEQLSISVKDLEQALPILEDLGFLERISMNAQPQPKKTKRKPDRTQSKADSAKQTKNAPKKNTKKSERKAQTAAKHAAGHSTAGFPDSAGLSRIETESSCQPSRKDKVKAKNNSKGCAKGKGQEQIEQSFASAKTVREEQEQSAHAPEGATPSERQGQQQDRTAATPATAPGSMNSTEPDAGQAKVIPFAGACPNSDRVSRAGPQTVGAVLSRQQHRYDGEAQAFALAVYEELGLPWDRDGREGRSELGCFAKVFHDGCKGLSTAEIAQIKMKALAHAAQVRKNAKRCRNPSAVWVKKFEGLVQGYQSKKCKAM